MSRKWPPEIIQIEWLDSVGTNSWESHKSKCDDLKDENLRHSSVGYLVKKTRQWVALTHSVGIAMQNCCDTIQIPMRAVTKISYLKAKP